MPIQLERDSHGFACPHCKQIWSVESWGTEYNAPIQGVSTVYCSACDGYFNIEVEVLVNILAVPSTP